MAENKKSLLAEFSRKAMQRLQAKKAHIGGLQSKGRCYKLKLEPVKHPHPSLHSNASLYVIITNLETVLQQIRQILMKPAHKRHYKHGFPSLANDLVALFPP